ncbi:taurine--pyruvate aminotransferase [Roseovarius sp. 217]|nr:taurine--pyruvate aminotransferase [Roseovarius sp. 217]
MDGKLRGNDISHVVEADRAHVWHHLIQHAPWGGTDPKADPRIIVEGRGMRVWDQKGKEHLDGVSGGVWTVNVGYGRERIANAVRDQLIKLPYFAGSAGSIPGALFSEKLISKMPGMSRVYYTNSGSEANEKAFKMVRQIAHKRYGGKKHKILYRDRDYHGTTIACLSAGGQDERNAQYGPYTPGFVRVPHCLEYRAQWDLEGEDYGIAAANAIEEVILAEGPDTIGALCLEPVTAGGGVIVPPAGYWPRVQEICRKYDILLHIDEVVCGIGRTGTWFGYQHYGVEPDFVTMAKGVASGYAAIACCVTNERVFDMFKDDTTDPMNYFRDISTFGGCTAVQRQRWKHGDHRGRGSLGQHRRHGRLHARPIARAQGQARGHRRCARQGAVSRGRTGQRPRQQRACPGKAGSGRRRRLHGAGRHHRCHQPLDPRVQQHAVLFARADCHQG